MIPIGIWFNHFTRKGGNVDWEKIVKEIWTYVQTEKPIGYVPWVIDPNSNNYDSKKHGIDIGRAQILEGVEDIIQKYIPNFQDDICPHCHNTGVIDIDEFSHGPCDCKYGQQANT